MRIRRFHAFSEFFAVFITCGAFAAVTVVSTGGIALGEVQPVAAEC